MTIGSILTPMDAGGIPRSLTWRGLLAVSRELAKEVPCHRALAGNTLRGPDGAQEPAPR